MMMSTLVMALTCHCSKDLKYNSEVALFSADSQQRVDIQGAYADGTKDSWATKFRILKVVCQ